MSRAHELDDDVLVAAVRGGAMTTRDVADRLAVSALAIRERMKRLAREGRICRVGTLRDGTTVIYGPPEKNPDPDDAHEIAETVRSVITHNKAKGVPCRGCLGDEALAELESLAARAGAYRDALSEAAIVIEVLRAQDAEKPYRELSPEMRDQIVRASDAMRAALEEQR